MNEKNVRALTGQLTALALLCCGAPPSPQPPTTANPPATSCSERVGTLLSQMTLQEKAGQMVQAWQANASPEDVRRYNLGAVFSGGDSAAWATGYDDRGKTDAESWADMLDAYHAAARSSRLAIPVLYGFDAVHGNSKATGATIFPHNIGLGAAADPALAEAIGRASAREVAAVGVNLVYGPSTIAAADERWGRTFESYSEDPTQAGLLAAATARGLQGNFDESHVLACAKHFAGDGLTDVGTSTAKPQWTNRHGILDRGDVSLGEEEFRRLAVEQYRPVIDAGVKIIMASFSSWNGKKSHGDYHLLTEILKQELGFRGFVTGDYQGHSELGATISDQVVAAFNAGIDMVMEPVEWKSTLQAIVAEAGKRLPNERIDDAVGRILAVKCEAGLFDRERDPRLLTELGAPSHRALARRAVAESLVLLKNEGSAQRPPPLPLAEGSRVFLAGSGADDLTPQCGGWTITWQGGGSQTVGTTLLEAVSKRATVSTNVADADVAVVVLAEPSYAEWFGDDPDIEFDARDIEALKRARASGKPTVAVMFSGRPMIIAPHLGLADSWVAAWLPGTEGDGIADVLFGDHPPTGKLSHSWPRTVAQLPLSPWAKPYDPLFPLGYGLGYEPRP